MTSESDFNPGQLRNFPPARDCWYLTGPTASGKTEIGVELADRLGGEIVSMDSMAVYQGMNLGTAKPTADDRRRVRHHLLDLVTPDQQFSLSQFVAAAHGVIDDIRRRGRDVLFVGGTPLYLKALLRGVYPGPPADWTFRREVEAELREAGIAALHARLAQVDPLSAARLHPHDKRRIIRALEVYKVTGRPISHGQTHFDEPPRGDCRAFVICWPREQLHCRIDARVERMFSAGLVDEVRGLLDRYGQLGRTAAQAVGYREVIEYLAGERGLEETMTLVKTRTRQFARRQQTWFRSLPECHPVTLDTDGTVSGTALRILDLAASGPSGEP